MSEQERSTHKPNTLLALPTDNVLIPTTEISFYTGSERQTHNRWRHEGKGPRWIKTGRKVFYWADDVREWLQSCYQSGSHGQELDQLDTRLEGSSTRRTKLDIKKFKQ